MRMRFFRAQNRPESIVSAPRRSFIARMLGLAGASALFGGAARAATAPRQVTGASPFVGEISIVGFNFAPNGWARCDGQILPIAQYTALFSLIGTTYGGDGQTTFALPNLNGRAANHQGAGPGLSGRSIGEQGGTENETLVTGQLPAHTHTMRADAAVGTTDSPAGAYPARNAAGVPAYGNDPAAYMGETLIAPTGGNQSHDNMQPFLAMNFVIALQGIYPSQ